MASLQLWLLRHGATEWAVNGRHTGSTDLPLLPEGEREAQALAPVLARQTLRSGLQQPPAAGPAQPVNWLGWAIKLRSSRT